VAANLLIAFYSHSGNTRQIANLIHNEIGGTLYEIKPKDPYPSGYNAVLDRAKGEIDRGYNPPLLSTPDSIEKYDTIFVGTPNWYSTIAPPVATFLSAHDFSGNAILPFCTHGGGERGHIPEDIAKLCPRASILSCLCLYGSGGRKAQAEISAWLDGLRLTH